MGKMKENNDDEDNNDRCLPPAHREEVDYE